MTFMGTLRARHRGTPLFPVPPHAASAYSRTDGDTKRNPDRNPERQVVRSRPDQHAKRNADYDAATCNSVSLHDADAAGPD
jgi:hypothetical protein